MRTNQKLKGMISQKLGKRQRSKYKWSDQAACLFNKFDYLRNDIFIEIIR